MKILKDIDLDGKDLRIIQNMYWKQTAAIRVDNELSQPQPIKRGVRQGCVLSPELFSLYSKMILRKVEGKPGVKVGGQNINKLRYADDTILIAGNEEDLQSLVNIINEESEKMGIGLNVKKTECMGSSATESCVLKLQEKAAPVPVPQEVVCSQNSANDFTCGPWQQMLNDLELDQNNPKCPLEVFNIKWVLRRASLRGQAAVRKVPFLAVMLRNLDVTHVDAQALLKDKTGEMNATVASSVMEEYGPLLQTG
ncbi:endonuclease-reverse transcriptase, partial [Penaeus vannamei]